MYRKCSIYARYAVALFVILPLLQVPEAVQAQRFSVQNYGISEGLPNPTITGIVEDSLGYLWIGTAGGGIARFDGREFTSFHESNGLIYNTVTCLALGRSGLLWIGTGRGISCFDGKTFKNFLFHNPYHLQQAYIIDMAVVADTLLFLTSRGQLGKIYRDSVLYDPNAEKINALVSSGHNELYLLYRGGKLMYRCGSVLRYYQLPGEPVRRLSVTKVRGSVILSGYPKLLKLHDNGTVEPLEALPESMLVAYDTLHDTGWSINALGLQSTRSGIDFFPEESIPQITDISVSVIDSEGNNWFGTYGQGLFKVRKNDFVKIVEHDFVRSIFRDSRGTLWVGTIGSGLKRIDSSHTTPIIFSTPGQNIVRDIIEDKSGELILATHDGLLRFNRDTQAYDVNGKKHGLASDSVYCLEFDPEGNLWAGTLGKGLMRFGKEGYKRYTWRDSLHNDYIFSLQSWGEKLFIGTSRGLNVFIRDRIEKITIPGFYERMIYSLAKLDNQHLLVASLGKGVAIMNTDSVTFRFITTREGLASDNIHFVAASDGVIWIGTDRGINRVKLNGQQQVSEVLLYNRKNGFYGVETSVNACLAEDSVFYAGSNDGLYHFSDNAKPYGRAHFALHLTAVRLFRNDNLPSGTAGFHDHPVLRHDQNHLTFYVNRVNKSSPESTVYRYKIQELEREWSPASKVQAITYNNLPGGTYTLLVEATDYSGHWGNDRLVYSFTILDPFYKRPIFFMAIGVTLLLGSLILIRFQIRRRVQQAVFVEKIKLGEQEKLRKEIARDFHDEMGNHLAKIINYIGMLRMKKGLSEEEVYNRVEQSAKQLNLGTKDFIWAIDPSNNELSNLFLYVKDFGEKLFQESDVKFRAYNMLEHDVRLSFGVARELIMIFKEAMTNAYKHAHACNIAYRLLHEGDQITMVLEDDGKGFTSGHQSGNGLSNIRARALRIHAQLQIISKPGETHLRITFTPANTAHAGH